jgi:hypothetical protein
VIINTLTKVCYRNSRFYAPIEIAIWDVYRVRQVLMHLYAISENDVIIFSHINGPHYPNADTIMHSILKIAKVMNRDDSMLCFFSGHGATLSRHMRKLGNRCICMPNMSCLTYSSS